jgi:anti-sigma B factor antagonist
VEIVPRGAGPVALWHGGWVAAVRPLLDTRAETTGNTVVLRVRGEIDLSTAAQFSAALRVVETARTVEVDLGGVTFMGSCGIERLMAARDAATTSGCDLTVTNVPRIVRRVLEIAGVDSLFALPDGR